LLALFALAPVAFVAVMVVALSSFAVFILWFWRDPGGLIEWWAD